MTHRIEPLAPGAAGSSASGCSTPTRWRTPGFDPSFAVDFWDLTNRQDWAACESVQRGIASRGYQPGPLRRGEDGVTQFVRLMARGYRDGALPAGVPFPTRKELTS